MPDNDEPPAPHVVVLEVAVPPISFNPNVVDTLYLKFEPETVSPTDNWKGYAVELEEVIA